MNAGIDTPILDRLEHGDVHLLNAPLPFRLPGADEQAFLRAQRLYNAKEIVLEPGNNRFTGFQAQSTSETVELRRILQSCHDEATRWIREALPTYAGAIEPFRTCFHVEEEATRCLRVTARHDLLHVDALHHSRGRRLLRLFVNLNPVDSRVWATSETLAKVLPERLPDFGLLELTPSRFSLRLGQEMLRFLKAERQILDPHDELMLEFTRSLKHCDDFQERAPRKLWRFTPGQAWLAFTDTLIHADLRGRWILDHLFLLPPSACLHPELSPAALVQSLRGQRRAAA